MDRAPVHILAQARVIPWMNAGLSPLTSTLHTHILTALMFRSGSIGWLIKDGYLGSRHGMGMRLSTEDVGPQENQSIWPLRIDDPLKTKWGAAGSYNRSTKYHSKKCISVALWQINAGVIDCPGILNSILLKVLGTKMRSSAVLIQQATINPSAL